VARIVVCGAGSVGACIAYHLALAGARDVVLADRQGIAAGSTGRAMGGVRQQFSTAAEVELARESVAFFAELGPGLFEQVGYLFLATSEQGWASLRERQAIQAGLGVPAELVACDALGDLAPGVACDDVVGAVYCGADGTADPTAITREIVRRARALGVEVREGVDGLTLAADVRVIACGAWSTQVAARLGVELPVRPLVRQLLETAPVRGLVAHLPMVVEAETGFHFRRRDDVLRVAMADATPRWSLEPSVDETVLTDRLARLGRRYPAARGTTAAHVWAGLYDMTPDGHPILDRVADDVWVACGFSGHGFMHSPAAGRALAAEILGVRAAIDLAPFRLSRFASGSSFDEQVVL
jgi:sarcosine oxidase subunit beta